PPEEAGPERWASARAAGFLRDFSPDPGSQPGAGVHGRGLCVESRGHVPSNLDQLPAVLAVGEVALERRPCPRVQEPERVTYRALLIVFGVPRRLARHLFVPRRSIPVWNTSQAMVPFPYTLNVSAQPLRAARAHMGDTCAQSPAAGERGPKAGMGRALTLVSVMEMDAETPSSVMLARVFTPTRFLVAAGPGPAVNNRSAREPDASIRSRFVCEQIRGSPTAPPRWPCPTEHRAASVDCGEWRRTAPSLPRP